MEENNKVIDFNDVFNDNNHYSGFHTLIKDIKYKFIKNILFKNNLINLKNHSVPAVYVIKNIMDGLFYIGSTKDICTRISHHKGDLLFKRNHNKKLQDSFNNTYLAHHWFTLIVIFIDNREDAYDIEQYLLDLYKNDLKICNKAINSRRSGLGLPMNEKAKINMSKVQKGIIRSKDTRLRLSLGHLPNINSNYNLDGNIEKYKQLTIDGVKYLSIRHASKELHKCRKEIRRKLNDPKYENYTLS